jgi:Phage P22-like portal protein
MARKDKAWYEDHSKVIAALEKAQDADHDRREMARQAHNFIDDPDGQWEASAVTKFKDKPRYTFDEVDNLVDQVSGYMERSDFDIKIIPSSGPASKESAKTYDGLVRHIEAISSASDIYNRAGRNVVTSGLDGWRVINTYLNEDSFDQDLIIEEVGNFLDRVWFGPHEKPDASDAKFCYVMTWLADCDYQEEYPDRPKMSLDSDRTEVRYFASRQDMTAVGEFLYLKEVDRDLVLMSTGAVLEDNEDFQTTLDEMTAAGITEVSRRKGKKKVCCVRKFDASGWIDEPVETVFQNWLPVVPCYGNFKLINNTIKYRGVVEKLKDPQRVLNYSLSREIEEGALAPRSKILATLKQAEGFEEQWAQLNTSADPVMFYNPDPEAMGPPSQIMGAQINAGLRTLSDTMERIITTQAGMYDANLGKNTGLQSGKAIEALQDRGDVGNNKYMSARETSQRQTGRILVNAIPRVYTPGRQVRLLSEDGAQDMVTIGQEVIDQQTQRKVVLNDLSTGSYDVLVESGPSFKNRQNETVRAVSELGAIDPSVIQVGKDILVNNIPSPGMDQLGRRLRRQAFQAGLIPQEDMTEEEAAEAQAMQQQPQQEDPNMVLARAEEAKAQAEMVNAQTKQMESQANAQLKQGELQVKAQQLEVDMFNAQTDRYKAEIEKAEVEAKIKGHIASAAKDLASAEAQDVETDMVISGIQDMMQRLGANGG